ncbi:MAG: GAF domain-containing protein, partial [Micromonosporaceae bacterium]|nr:GAF domain-containing protein [Micromonosporaceae bacterium]
MTLAITGLSGMVLREIVLRRSVAKAAFNVAVFNAGLACASGIVNGFGLDGVGPRTWGVLALAVFAHTQITLLGVVGAIILVQGVSQIRRLGHSAGFGAIVTTINIVIGLIVILTIRADTWAAPLIVVLAVLLLLVYRAYAKFARQHRSLEELYELTQVLAVSSQDASLFDVILVRVREVLQAESATLWLPQHGRHPEVLLSARADYKGLLDDPLTPDVLRTRALGSGETILVNAKAGPDDLRARLAACNVKDAAVVPLRCGGIVVGTLEIAGRLGDRTAFGADDVRLVETLAAHAAVAVENSRLVDRLRYDALHDLLTGLPNRRRMLEGLAAAIAAPAVDDV